MPRGRPHQLTPELQAKICEIIGQGNYREVAAVSVGVSKSSLHHWVLEGKRQKKGRYKNFLQAVLEAEKLAEIVAVKRIYEAGAADPAHARWWLERKFPDRWGTDRPTIAKLLRELEEALVNVRALESLTAQMREAQQASAGSGPATNGDQTNGHV